ncbi:hypothetical protein [Avibacterium avium]|uniref:hypothetical protein n=1 Tax=Avibacterium avium TaxID=751 RepID=UPI003BF85FB6
MTKCKTQLNHAENSSSLNLNMNSVEIPQKKTDDISLHCSKSNVDISFLELFSGFDKSFIETLENREK